MRTRFVLFPSLIFSSHLTCPPFHANHMLPVQVPYTCCKLKSENMNKSEVVDLQKCMDDANAANFDSKVLHTQVLAPPHFKAYGLLLFLESVYCWGWLELSSCETYFFSRMLHILLLLHSHVSDLLAVCIKSHQAANHALISLQQLHPGSKQHQQMLQIFLAQYYPWKELTVCYCSLAYCILP